MIFEVELQETEFDGHLVLRGMLLELYRKMAFVAAWIAERESRRVENLRWLR